MKYVSCAVEPSKMDYSADIGVLLLSVLIFGVVLKGHPRESTNFEVPHFGACVFQSCSGQEGELMTCVPWSNPS